MNFFLKLKMAQVERYAPNDLFRWSACLFCFGKCFEKPLISTTKLRDNCSLTGANYGNFGCERLCVLAQFFSLNQGISRQIEGTKSTTIIRSTLWSLQNKYGSKTSKQTDKIEYYDRTFPLTVVAASADNVCQHNYFLQINVFNDNLSQNSPKSIHYLNYPKYIVVVTEQLRK